MVKMSRALRLQAYARGSYVPEFVWFVWACKSETDLDWCWRTLQSALFDAVKSGALKMGEDWSPLSSNMLDWLGVTIYATRAQRSKLDEFLDENALSPEEEVYMHIRDRSRGGGGMLSDRGGPTAPMIANPARRRRHEDSPTSLRVHHPW